MSSPTFRLFWLRETGCEAGVVREAGEIEPAIRDRIMALTGGEGGEFTLRLPYQDRYEWKRRSTILRTLDYERDGRLIRAILKPAEATRDLAATLALTDPAWSHTPPERDHAYHEVWHRVSVAVQRALKEAIAQVYFRDLSRLQKRDSAYTMVVYQSSRAFTAKSRHRFTYDLRDYPDCRPVVAAATMQIGARLEKALEQLQQRLIDAGHAELARRYTPSWHPDVASAVRRKPRRLLDLLMREAEIVNAVIEMGADRSHLAVYSCARKINTVLRCVQGVDMRTIGVELLEAATSALTQSPFAQSPFAQSMDGGGQDVVDGGAPEHGNVIAARRPDLRVGGHKDGDHGNAHGSGQVSDARIVADVETGGSKPNGQLI
ncbi:MAG TPA: hypothetical protein VN841_15590 [Bryobacteraceae bacterium]|nr:hypothetical protein [Bryobacteraceae bacterium]